MKRFWLGLVGVGLFGCEEPVTRPVASVVSAPKSERLEGFVVVAVGTPLRSAPRDGGTYVVTARTADAARLRDLHIGNDVYRVVAEQGDFVEVESTGESPFDATSAHCSRPRGALASLSVKFFVRRSELVPVVKTATTLTNADGTSLRLQAGALLYPQKTAANAYTVESGNVVLAIPEKALRDNVGTSYRPEPRFAVASSEDAVDPQAFHLGEVRFDGKAVGARYPNLVEPIEVKRAPGGRALVTMRSACAEVVVSVPDARLRSKASVVGGMVGMSKSPDRYVAHVRKGAALFDLAGHQVGVTTDDTGFETEIAPVGSKRCFTRTLVDLWDAKGRTPSRPEEILSICVAPEDL